MGRKAAYVGEGWHEGPTWARGYFVLGTALRSVILKVRTNNDETFRQEGEGIMSLLGNLMREISKAAANVGEAMVHGAADVTEVVTGPNRVTEAVRDTGVKVIQGVRAISDAVVDMGEEVFGVAKEPSRTAEQHTPHAEGASNA